MKKNIDKKIINKNNYKSKNNLNEPYDKKTFISIIALPLSLVYILICAILKFKFFKPKQICKKTIGISSFAFNSDVKYICIAIANELKSKGKNVCFVEKQHGKYKKKLVVPYNHYKIFNDFEVSDDVLLFSKYADVLAVKNRKKAKTNNYDIAICNDSFFDFEIKKDCSILVLDDVFFVGNGNAYPSGKLKYKISYIKKANFVIIKQITDNDIYKKIIFLTKFIPLEKILTAKIVINKDYDLTNKYLVFS